MAKVDSCKHKKNATFSMPCVLSITGYICIFRKRKMGREGKKIIRQGKIRIERYALTFKYNFVLYLIN